MRWAVEDTTHLIAKGLRRQATFLVVDWLTGEDEDERRLEEITTIRILVCRPEPRRGCHAWAGPNEGAFVCDVARVASDFCGPASGA